MEITFTNGIYLVFLISIPLLIITHFFTLKYLERRAFMFANFEAIKRVTGAEFSLKNSAAVSKNLLLLLIRVIVLLLLIFSAAGTIIWITGQSSEFNYVLAIDSSSSMLADDFEPNRLSAAQDAAIAFVDSLPSTANVAVVSFAGTSFLNQELTDDHDKVKQAINDLQISSIGGTDIGGAIISATNVLLNSEKSKVIILLTDGQDNVGASVEEGINYANDRQVTVNTVGVGTPEGGRFLNTESVSRLDDESLKSIASNTGGRYFQASSKESLLESFSSIAKSNTEKIPIRLSLGFMLAAITLIFVEWGLISTKFRSIP